MDAAICNNAECAEKCRRENSLHTGGYCNIFRVCKCNTVKCVDDEVCAANCKRKSPDLFKGGHCRWGWCKCDTQAWRRLVPYLLNFINFINWPRHAKTCLRVCAKICGFTSSCACTRSHPGRCSQLVHSIVANDSCNACPEGTFSLEASHLTT